MTTQYIMMAAFTLTLTNGPALAGPVRPDEAPRQAAVSYADLNLNSAKGQAILVARIHRAAEAVCGPEPDARDVKAQMAFRDCMKQSVDTAVAAIPTARLLAGKIKPAG